MVPLASMMDISPEAVAACIARNSQAAAMAASALASTPLIDQILLEDSDEERTPVKRNKVAKNTGFWESVVPTLTDSQFKSHFRINRATFEAILTFVSSHMKTEDTNFKAAVPVAKKIAIALAVSVSIPGISGITLL